MHNMCVCLGLDCRNREQVESDLDRCLHTWKGTVYASAGKNRVYAMCVLRKEQGKHTYDIGQRAHTISSSKFKYLGFTVHGLIQILIRLTREKIKKNVSIFLYFSIKYMTGLEGANRDSIHIWHLNPIADSLIIHLQTNDICMIL